LLQRDCAARLGEAQKERPRLIHVVYSFFGMFENVYLHYSDGSADQDVWTCSQPTLLAYSTQPGARYYLQYRERIFDLRFRQFLQENTSSDVPPGHIVGKLSERGIRMARGRGIRDCRP
jgi:hypothetical protein